MSAGIGTETQCIIVMIVRGNLTSSLQKTQLQARAPLARAALRLPVSGPSESSGLSENSEQDKQLTTLEHSRGFTLPAFDITVQGPAIRFQ